MPRLSALLANTPKFTSDDNPYDHPFGHVLNAYFVAQVDILDTTSLTVRAHDEPGLFEVEIDGLTTRSVLTLAVYRGSDDLEFDVIDFEVRDIVFSDVTFSYNPDQPDAEMFRLMTAMLEEVFMTRRAAITDALLRHLRE